MGAADQPDGRRHARRGGSMNATPVRGRDGDARQVDDLDAGQAAVGDGGVERSCASSPSPGVPSTTGRPGPASADARLVVVRVAVQELGERASRPRPDRRSTAGSRRGRARSRPGARSAMPGRSTMPRTVARRDVDRGQAVVGRRQDGPAVRAHEQVLDRVVDASPAATGSMPMSTPPTPTGRARSWRSRRRRSRRAAARWRHRWRPPTRRARP